MSCPTKALQVKPHGLFTNLNFVLYVTEKLYLLSLLFEGLQCIMLLTKTCSPAACIYGLLSTTWLKKRGRNTENLAQRKNLDRLTAIFHNEVN